MSSAKASPTPLTDHWEPRTCPVCSETFYLPPSDTQKCCSVPCRDAALRAPHLAAYEADPRRCPCGEPIPYEHRHKRRYCSPPSRCREQFTKASSGFRRESAQRRVKREPIRPDQEQQAIRMYVDKGYGFGQIANALSCTEPSLRKLLKDVPRSGARTRRKGEDWEIEGARKMRAEGVSVAEIARQLNRSEGTVGNWVKDVLTPALEFHQTARRRRSTARRNEAVEASRRQELKLLQEEQDADQAAELYQGGMSLGRTAATIGRDIAWLKQRLQAAGIPLRHLLS